MKTPVHHKIGAFLLSGTRLVLNLFPVRALEFFFKAALKIQDRFGPDYMTVHARPKRAAASRCRLIDPILPGPRGLKPGIVVQGPLFHPYDFTLETIALYRTFWPEAEIICSTWEDENPAALNRIRELKAHVVTSKKPPNPGVVNVNYQTVSSGAGMLRARELGCTHAVKIRSDARIGSPQALAFLADLSNAFPLCDADAQKERLIGASLYTAYLVPHLICDHFMYGQIDDMLDYWSPPLGPEPPPYEREKFKVRDMTSESVPEIYIAVQYLKKLGRPFESTIKNHWRELASHFCTVNRETLDLYWPKYFPNNEILSSRRYEHMLGLYNLRFHDWLRLYTQFDESTVTPEHVLDWPAFSDPANYPPIRLESRTA